MNKLAKTAFIISIFISCIVPASAQYIISGQLNNYDSLWQNTISVSAINSLGQLHYASADIVINKDSLDKQGHFTINGNSLPDENRIYRLDLTNQKGRVMLQSGATTNYIYLILNNHSSVKINCPDFSKSSWVYQVEGSAENMALQKFEVYFSNLQKLFDSHDAQTKMVEQYATDKYNNSIRGYCDTCKYSTVALIAISEVIDFEKDYTAHTDFYHKFLNRMKTLAEPNSIYLQEFEKKLNLLDYQSKPVSTNKVTAKLLVYIEGVIILLLLGFVWYLKNKIKRNNDSSARKAEPDRGQLFETLTRREKEILSLLIEDIQNKEIASKLNLEVSTIKTHISKIYQKLAISNRNEVKAFEPFLKNKES